MNVRLENAVHSAEISTLGAELKSLKNLGSGQEYMWQADPSWWKGTAPVLFPIIGGLKGETYRYGGSTYRMPSHGFARTMDFSLRSRTDSEAEFVLPSNAETMEKYPFRFELSVRFSLNTDGIDVRYTVANRGTADMYFSLGSHPAFNVPFAGGSLEDYYCLFSRSENLVRWFFRDGMVEAGKTADILENSRTLSFSRTVFDAGPIIFKGPASTDFTLANGRNGRRITVTTDGVPFLGIWSKPNGAPFVCIEPWHGLPDSTEATGELTEKEGIMHLEAGSVFRTGYGIRIN